MTTTSHQQQQTICLCRHFSEEREDTASMTTRCPSCVQRILRPHRERHQAALDDHAGARRRLRKQLQIIQDPTQRLCSLQAESEHLRHQITRLKRQTSEIAVRVATRAVENDQHQESLQQYTSSGSDMTIPRQQQMDLMRLEQTLLEHSLGHAIAHATTQVRTMRFLWTLRVIKMHRLQVDESDTKQVMNQRNKQRIPRGVAKIAGLPLPNAGPELYGVLPVGELVSALRLVASLTCTTARTLSITLPHPILLSPTNNANTDITETVPTQQLLEYQQAQHGLVGGAGGGGTPGNPTQNQILNHNTDSLMLHHHHYQPQAATKNMEQQEAYCGMLPSATVPTSTSSSSSYLSSMVDGGSYFARKAKTALAKATRKATGNYGHRGLIPSAGTNVQQPSVYPPTSRNDQHSGMYAGHVTASSFTLPSTATFIPPSTDATIVAQRLKHATAAVLSDGDGDHASTFVLSPAMKEDFPIALQLLQNNILTLCIRSGVSIQKLWPAQALLLNFHELQIHCHEQTAMVDE